MEANWMLPPKVCGQGVPTDTAVVQAPVGTAEEATAPEFWAPCYRKIAATNDE
jgi:hypothetical protein